MSALDLELANAASLSTLLSQLGHPALPQRLIELARGHISPAFVLAILREHGQCAREVRISTGGLSKLETPTLLVLRSGEMCVLESVVGGKATLQDSSGQRVERALEPLTVETSLAIDRGASGALRGSFLDHLARLVGHSYLSQIWLLPVSIASVGLSLLLPWLMREALARALPEQANSLLTAVVVGVAACACLKAWLGWLIARTRLSLDVQVVRSACVAIFRRVLRLPYAEHQTRGLGKLLQILDSTEAAARLASTVFAITLLEALTALGYLGCLSLSAPSLGFLLATLVLSGFAGSSMLARRSTRLRTEELDHATRARASLHELIQGIATVKASRAEEYGLLRWVRALVAERGIGLSREFTDAWSVGWADGLERVGNVAVLAWATVAVANGELAVADLVYLAMLAAGLLHSSTELNRELSKVWVAWTHLGRVNDLLRCSPAPSPRLGAALIVESEGPVIELCDVWFRYGPDQPWILKEYTLKIRRNEHLKLRGKTGIGKTTVLRLIAGLYRPERGTVSVLGKDPWRDRSATAYLPQFTSLIAGSIRHNLEHLSLASFDKVVRACAKTGLSEWLGALPMGLETLLASGGASISGGQRQWIVLTAAAASERPIVLLDEAMSQMDHALRSSLSEADLFCGKTSVSVSHDC